MLDFATDQITCNLLGYQMLACAAIFIILPMKVVLSTIYISMTWSANNSLQVPPKRHLINVALNSLNKY